MRVITPVHGELYSQSTFFFKCYSSLGDGDRVRCRQPPCAIIFRVMVRPAQGMTSPRYQVQSPAMCKGFLSQPATRPNHALPPSTYRFAKKRTQIRGDNFYHQNVSGELPTSHRLFGPPDHHIQTPLSEGNISGWSPDLASTIGAEKAPVLHLPKQVHRARLVGHVPLCMPVPETASIY